jgi:hypothetical protein
MAEEYAEMEEERRGGGGGTALTGSLKGTVSRIRSSVADPGSGACLPPGSGIRDGTMVGSGISKQNVLIAFIQK